MYVCLVVNEGETVLKTSLYQAQGQSIQFQQDSLVFPASPDSQFLQVFLMDSTHK